MNWKKIILWLVIIGLIWYLITDPQGAAQLTDSTVTALRKLGDSLGTFFNSL